jgi:hypothetical protein
LDMAVIEQLFIEWFVTVWTESLRLYSRHNTMAATPNLQTWLLVVL